MKELVLVVIVAVILSMMMFGRVRRPSFFSRGATVVARFHRDILYRGDVYNVSDDARGWQDIDYLNASSLKILDRDFFKSHTLVMSTERGRSGRQVRFWVGPDNVSRLQWYSSSGSRFTRDVKDIFTDVCQNRITVSGLNQAPRFLKDFRRIRYYMRRSDANPWYHMVYTSYSRLKQRNINDKFKYFKVVPGVRELPVPQGNASCDYEPWQLKPRYTRSAHDLDLVGDYSVI